VPAASKENRKTDGPPVLELVDIPRFCVRFGERQVLQDLLDHALALAGSAQVDGIDGHEVPVVQTLRRDLVLPLGDPVHHDHDRIHEDRPLASQGVRDICGGCHAVGLEGRTELVVHLTARLAERTDNCAIKFCLYL
jgi:hypothetical protein